MLSALAEADADAAHGAPAKHRVVVGGIYGLGSKEFTPAMAVSVYDNLALPNPKRRFTVRRREGRLLFVEERVQCPPCRPCALRVAFV